MQSCGNEGLSLTRFLTSAHSCRLYSLSEHLGLILALSFCGRGEGPFPSYNTGNLSSGEAHAAPLTTGKARPQLLPRPYDVGCGEENQGAPPAQLPFRLQHLPQSPCK